MKKSKLGLLVSMSLAASSFIPLRSVAEQVSAEQISNQLEIENPTIFDKAEISVDEETEDTGLDKENDLEKVIEIPEVNGEVVDGVKKEVIDSTIIDQGTMEAGVWKYYSNGLLYMDGVVYPSDINKWKEYVSDVLSIEVGHAALVGDFTSFFSVFVNLESVTMGETYLNEITNMSRMFAGLTKLKYVSFGAAESRYKSVNVTNMTLMFSNCINLTRVDLSMIDTSEVTTMERMFYGCRGLTELDVSGFDTSKVTSMAYMFYGCSGLTELDVSGFDTSEVTTMERMFCGCSGLTELDVSGFDTSKVTSMAYMFYGCSGLTELDVSGFDTSKVTSMAYMFIFCSALKELDVSGFDTSKVTTMVNMFYNCYSLNEISISKDFKFGPSTAFPTISGKYAWQEENNRQLFFSAADMIAYHNDSNETNTYRKVRYVELTMNAKDGKFEDGSEKITQIKVMDELWEEQIPTKENYQFDGWYLDEEYTREFDFSQPSTESLTIFAKWVENYTVTIPATINLNSEEKLTLSGINNGSGTLKVNLKEAESQISDYSRLRLTHKQNADTTAHTTLTWEQQSSDDWNVLTVNSEAHSVSKSADIRLSKPENAQAGDYEGQIVFSIRYE